METFKIKAILTAIEYKSLSKAAEEFSYTPSALSHMTAAFEKELGVRLFKRSSAGVELTEEGKVLYPKFKAMMDCEQDLLQTVARLTGTEHDELRIGTYSSISRNYLSGLFKKLKKEYPHIKLSIHVADVLDGWLENGKADIIFADSNAFGKGDWVPMAEDRFCVVAPPHMLRGKESITREELYDYPHIFSDDFYIRRYFDTEKFKEFIYFKSEDDLSLLNMVKNGIGLTVIPELVLKETLDGVSVIRLEPELKRVLGFAYNQDRIRALGLTKFIKSLKM